MRGLGGHRTPDRYSIEHGVGMLVAGPIPTGRFSLLNEPGCKLSAAFLVVWMKNLGDVLPERLGRCSRNRHRARGARQDRVQPAWYLFGNGCHCNRDSVAEMKRSGLEIETLNEGRIPRAWSIVEAMITGCARRPASELTERLTGCIAACAG